MRVQPKSEAEVESPGYELLPPGEYDFEIAEAEETTSKAGNEMVKLKVWIFPANGGRRVVFDYLVSSDNAAFKVRGFAKGTGMLADYEAGDMPAGNMVGKSGRCKITIQKDTTGQYEDRNAVGAYLPARAAAPQDRPQQPRQPPPVRQNASGPNFDAPKSGNIDDEIPF